MCAHIITPSSNSEIYTLFLCVTLFAYIIFYYSLFLCSFTIACILTSFSLLLTHNSSVSSFPPFCYTLPDSLLLSTLYISLCSFAIMYLYPLSLHFTSQLYHMLWVFIQPSCHSQLEGHCILAGFAHYKLIYSILKTPSSRCCFCQSLLIVMHFHFPIFLLRSN